MTGAEQPTPSTALPFSWNMKRNALQNAARYVSNPQPKRQDKKETNSHYWEVSDGPFVAA
jgi:hypothetical protein